MIAVLFSELLRNTNQRQCTAVEYRAVQCETPRGHGAARSPVHLDLGNHRKWRTIDAP